MGNEGSFLSQVEGFTPVIDVLAKELGLMTSVVYGVIWRYCQRRNGVCNASLDKIAEHVDVSRKTIERHVKKLCDAGYLRDLTPDLKNRPHTYADTGKAKIIGLVRAQVTETESPTEDEAGKTESPSGKTESPSGSDRESYPGQTESLMKRHETHGEEEETPRDYLGDIIGFQSGNEGVANPLDEHERWFIYRDKALEIYRARAGPLGFTTEERETRKGAVLGFVAEEASFDPDLWEASIIAWVNSGGNPRNIAKIIATYRAGGDVDAMWGRRNGRESRPEPVIVVEGEKRYRVVK